MGQKALSLEARAGIDNLITRFFWCLDNDAIEEAALMFTDDAWLEMGVPDRPRVQGPDGVRKLFGVRPEGRVVRHHWSNLMVLSAEDEIHASFQFTTYTGRKDNVAAPQAVVIGEVDALFRFDSNDGRWHFANMDRKVLFSS